MKKLICVLMFTLAIVVIGKGFCFNVKAANKMCSHKERKLVKTDAATCVKKGKKTYYCSKCRKYYYQSIAKLNHPKKFWKYATPPDCVHNGVAIWKCQKAGCGKTELREAKALGHKWKKYTKSNKKKFDSYFLYWEGTGTICERCSEPKTKVVKTGKAYCNIVNAKSTIDALTTVDHLEEYLAEKGFGELAKKIGESGLNGNSLCSCSKPNLTTIKKFSLGKKSVTLNFKWKPVRKASLTIKIGVCKKCKKVGATASW